MAPPHHQLGTLDELGISDEFGEGLRLFFLSTSALQKKVKTTERITKALGQLDPDESPEYHDNFILGGLSSLSLKIS